MKIGTDKVLGKKMLCDAYSSTPKVISPMSYLVPNPRYLKWIEDYN
jgi:hypothetical protein